MNFAKKVLLSLVVLIFFASIFILPNIFIPTAIAAGCDITSFNISGNNINFKITGISPGNTYDVKLLANMDNGTFDVAPTKSYVITDPAQTSISDKFSINDIDPFYTPDNPAFKSYSIIVFANHFTCDTSETSGTGISGENPCGANCETALGNIPTSPEAFAGKILSIAIGLAGGIAFILMVIGAIRVLTSTGNPQNVNAGRDMIVAALAGLIFIIFSVLILKFIGVNIFGGGLNPFS